MKDKSLEWELKKLGIDSNIIYKLNLHNIINIKDLWYLTKKQLRELGINASELNHFSIKLKLRGIDFGGKIYNRN